MPKFKILLIILLLSQNVNSQTLKGLSDQLVESGWYKIDNIEFSKGYHNESSISYGTWNVSILNGTVSVTEFVRKDSIYFHLPDGYLRVKRNQYAEGKLIFCKTDVNSDNNAIELMNVGNDVFIFQYADKLCVLEGSYSLAQSNGRMIYLFRKGNDWKIRNVYNLKESPSAYTIDKNGSLYIVTENRLLRFKGDKLDKVIIRNAFWSNFHPVSLSVYGSEVLIGLYNGICLVDLKSNSCYSFIRKK